ncbi:MAG: glycosyltransferase [Verrucomicrobiae bacterium]|nr:glycosyltransferase [Verrucomicrobiae bacterium]
MKSALKICDVTQFYSPVSGGVKRYLTEKRDYLEQYTDHEHVLIVPGPRTTMEQKGRLKTCYVAAPRVSFTSHYRIVLNRKPVLEAILRENPDVIEAGEPYQLAWTCLRAGQQLRKPVVGFYHSHFPESYLRTFSRFGGPPTAALVDSISQSYIRKLYGRFDLTLVASTKLEKVLNGIGVHNTRIVPLGVETDVFVPALRSMEWRRSLGIRDRQILLLFVGRLAREKRLDCLLQAFARVRHYAGDRFALLIVGEGGEGARVEEFQKIQHDVYRLPYEGDTKKLASIYASADLMVHAGLCETFGLVVLEAQACGTPAIAIHGSGMEENIFGGGDFLCHGSDPESLAKCILHAYQNDLREVGRQAREMVIQKYPWTVVFRRLFDLYSQLAAKK